MNFATTFFSRVKVYFFAGAGLSQAAWDRLERVTETYCGERIRIMAGLGMTETSPSCLFTTGPIMRAGYVGLPAPGCEVKLVPVAGKLEARFRGPHVMAGYWRMDAAGAAEAFDEEGYYRSGDALEFVDPHKPELGLMFDGRIAEDFKLSSGTFVSVGPMRARVISEGAPYVQDVVVTGMNRDDVGALVFPRLDDCRRLADLPASASAGEIVSSARRARILHQLARSPEPRVYRWRNDDRTIAPARCCTFTRPGRDHRQGLDQSARGTHASCGAGRRDAWSARERSAGDLRD